MVQEVHLFQVAVVEPEVLESLQAQLQVVIVLHQEAHLQQYLCLLQQQVIL